MDDFDQYRPTGLCAMDCGHPATELFVLYRGQSRFDFRCKCCVARDKVDRALWAIANLPALEEAFHAAEAICGVKAELK